LASSGGVERRERRETSFPGYRKRLSLAAHERGSVRKMGTETPAGGPLTGTVRWWKSEKGYGRITGDDGHVYFASFAHITGVTAFRELEQGQRVEFEWLGLEADHGRRAPANIRVLS
jgi:CspA family cold shock protein